MNEVVIATVNRNQYSETFIHDQVNGLPTNVHFLHGGYLPDQVFGNPLMAASLPTIFQGKLKSVVDRFSKKNRRKQLATYITKNRIEAVIAHYGPVGVEMVEVCEITNIPLLVYFHGYDCYRTSELKKFATAYRRLFDKAGVIFSVSKTMTEALNELGCPVEKIVYNPCGVKTADFKFVEAGKNPPVFLAIGRMVEKKGFKYLLKAFANLLSTGCEATLKIAGDGPQFSELKLLVNKLHIEKNVEFVGRLTRAEVKTFLATGRALVQPSIIGSNGDCEGTPLSILEACAGGLPVIGSDVGGIPDVVNHEKSGLLVPPKNIAMLSDAMHNLAQNPQTASTFGQNARAIVEVNFSLKNSIDRLWNCCLKLKTQPEP